MEPVVHTHTHTRTRAHTNTHVHTHTHTHTHTQSCSVLSSESTTIPHTYCSLQNESRLKRRNYSTQKKIIHRSKQRNIFLKFGTRKKEWHRQQSRQQLAVSHRIRQDILMQVVVEFTQKYRPGRCLCCGTIRTVEEGFQELDLQCLHTWYGRHKQNWDDRVINISSTRQRLCDTD